MPTLTGEGINTYTHTTQTKMWYFKRFSHIFMKNPDFCAKSGSNLDHFGQKSPDPDQSPELRTNLGALIRTQKPKNKDLLRTQFQFFFFILNKDTYGKSSYTEFMRPKSDQFTHLLTTCNAAPSAKPKMATRGHKMADEV